MHVRNDIIFHKNTPLKIGQEKFFANAKNNSNFMDMLRSTLAENKIFSCQVETDGDRLIIIETAINLQSENVVVSENDSFTDCAFTNRLRNLFSKTSKRQNTTKSILI